MVPNIFKILKIARAGFREGGVAKSCLGNAHMTIQGPLFIKGTSLIYPDLWIILNNLEFGNIYLVFLKILKMYLALPKFEEKKRDIYSEVRGKI